MWTQPRTPTDTGSVWLPISGAAPAVRLELDAFGTSHRGRVRPGNEDSFAVVAPRRGGLQQRHNLPHDLPLAAEVEREGTLLLAIADGVGGQAGGEVASRIAIEAVVRRLADHPWGGLDDGDAAALRRAVQGAQLALRAEAQAEPRLREMGTTLTVAAIHDGWLRAAHVGDTRLYLWRGGRLHRLTTDHTMAEKMAAEGWLPPGSDSSRWSSVLWNSLGAGQRPEIEETAVEVEPGDVVLLCSDGLSDMLDDRRIGELMAGAESAHRACDALLSAALEAGGRDNVTAVVARVSS
ncbi:MAG TPA: protein phosphatase 2C domain-containing protein [Thermoanaerobaculia bacterium]|nr:protein phosphatase 2C domain-containing protein [Thermoanaerobaculia bacterium]